MTCNVFQHPARSRNLRVFSRFSWSRLSCSLAVSAFFFWVILHYALGGWELAWFLLSTIGPPAWIALGIVVALVLYRSDYRIDLPLFLAGLALGYWGEWWGTTRGVWTYWNGQTPPDYLPLLWGIGLLTVYHLNLLRDAVVQSFHRAPLVKRKSNPPQRDCFVAERSRPRPAFPVVRWFKTGSLVVLPLLAFASSAPRLAAVDWSTRLDAHLYAGILAGAVLVFGRLDADEAFGIYVCGMLLGGTYEWLGTWLREWSYVTNEVPPLWIIPLWGLACVSMVNLARALSRLVAFSFERLLLVLRQSSVR